MTRTVSFSWEEDFRSRCPGISRVRAGLKRVMMWTIPYFEDGRGQASIGRGLPFGLLDCRIFSGEPGT